MEEKALEDESYLETSQRNSKDNSDSPSFFTSSAFLGLLCIIIASVILLILFATICLCYLRRKRKKRSKDKIKEKHKEKPKEKETEEIGMRQDEHKLRKDEMSPGQKTEHKNRNVQTSTIGESKLDMDHTQDKGQMSKLKVEVNKKEDVSTYTIIGGVIAKPSEGMVLKPGEGIMSKPGEGTASKTGEGMASKTGDVVTPSVAADMRAMGLGDPKSDEIRSALNLKSKGVKLTTLFKADDKVKQGDAMTPSMIADMRAMGLGDPNSDEIRSALNLKSKSPETHQHHTHHHKTHHS